MTTTDTRIEEIAAECAEAIQADANDQDTGLNLVLAAQLIEYAIKRAVNRSKAEASTLNTVTGPSYGELAAEVLRLRKLLERPA